MSVVFARRLVAQAPALAPGDPHLMSFRMRCPKCHSSNLDLEEDQRAFLGGGRHQVLLHCYTCGMILYGEQRIQEEFERQRVEWEKQLKERQERAARARAARAARAAVRPRPKPRPTPAVAPPANVAPPATNAAKEPAPVVASAPEVAPAPSAVEAQVPPSTAPPAAARATDPAPEAPAVAAPAPDAATTADATPAKAAKPKAKAKPKVAASAESTQCSWKGCEKIARPNSKYCSRNCSNKNARARHAARKKKKPAAP